MRAAVCAHPAGLHPVQRSAPTAATAKASEADHQRHLPQMHRRKQVTKRPPGRACLADCSCLQMSDVNPVTALLAAPSLRKRPMKTPNLKSLWLFFLPLHEHVKGFLSKCTVLKVDLSQAHQIDFFSGVYFSAWKFYRLGQ